jgi:hypothetical protein
VKGGAGEAIGRGRLPIQTDSELVGPYVPKQRFFRIKRRLAAYTDVIFLFRQNIALLQFTAESASPLLISVFEAVGFASCKVFSKLSDFLFFGHLPPLCLFQHKPAFRTDLLTNLLVDEELELSRTHPVASYNNERNIHQLHLVGYTVVHSLQTFNVVVLCCFETACGERRDSSTFRPHLHLLGLPSLPHLDSHHNLMSVIFDLTSHNFSKLPLPLLIFLLLIKIDHLSMSQTSGFEF